MHLRQEILACRPPGGSAAAQRSTLGPLRNCDVGGAFVCQRSDQLGGLKCVSYWLAQLSSHLRLDLQGAFTINKPPTLNQSRARLSNSLGGPMD